MNCMNQSRGLQDVAARTSTSTIQSLIQLHEAGHGKLRTSQSVLGARNYSNYILEQPSLMSKGADGQDELKCKVEGRNCVLVAVNAAKMSRHALEWALTNIVQPEDHVTLLALLPAGPGRRLWSLVLISGDCARRTVVRRGAKLTGKPDQDVEEEISEGCSGMMQELRSLCDSKKARVSIKVVAEGERGTIAMEADRIGASWVVLDKHVMKKEGKVCLEQLKCNVVLVKQSKSSKILRLNLRARHADDPKLASAHELLANTEIPSLPTDNENARVISKENRKCDYSGYNKPGALRRVAAAANNAAPRLSSSSKSCRANHRFNDIMNTDFYDGAASSDNSGDAENATAACAHLFSSDSETDSTTARQSRYVEVLYADQPQLDSDHDECGYSELDILSSSSCETNGKFPCEHSGLLCTPATASPSNDPQESRFDVNFPAAGQQVFTRGKGEKEGLCRDEAWRAAAPMSCLITCGRSSVSMSKSKPNSASTTPKSDTFTLTGSSYPKPSRSPSPSNQHAPTVTSTNHKAPPAPCSARVSRSPSPSKSNSCPPPNTHNAVGVKLSSSSACTNLFYSASTTSPAACTPRSRSHLIPCPRSSQTGTQSSKLMPKWALLAFLGIK